MANYRVFFKDWNFVLSDVKKNFVTTDDFQDADVVVSWNDILDADREIILTANILGKPTLIMQHGLYSCREYISPHNSPLLANKIMVWGPEEKKKLISGGINENRIVVTGTTLFDHLISRKPHKGANIIFSPMHWDYVIDENKVIANKLRDIKKINIITKLIEGMDGSYFQNPVFSDRSMPDHLNICASVLSKADLVISINEGTFELFACYLGIPVILVDCWKPKLFMNRLYYPEIRSRFSSACYFTDINNLEEVIFNTLANPSKLNNERKKTLYDYAGVGWSTYKPLELISHTINEAIQQKENNSQIDKAMNRIENTNNALISEMKRTNKGMVDLYINYQTQLSEKNEQLAEKEVVLDQTQKQLMKKEAALNHTQEQLLEIEGSKSWKVAQFLKKIRRIF